MNLLAKASINLVLICLLVACGGGGGDIAGGDDTSGSVDPGLLPLYQYLVAGVGDGVTLTLDGNVIRINPDPSTSSGLTGELVCNTTTEECSLSTVDEGSGIDVSDVSGTLFGDFLIRVKTQITLAVNGGVPTGGSMEIMSTNEGIITLNVVTSPAPGVQVLDDGADKGTYTWQQLDELIDTSSDPVLQLASVANGITDLGMLPLRIAMDSFDLIEEIEILGVNSAYWMCLAFSDSGLIPPIGYVDQGMGTFQWIDDNPGDVDPGDSFRIGFTECWEEDGDSLKDGGIDLVSWTAVTNANNVITRLGFEGSTQGKTGGVFFDSFETTDIDFGGSTPGQPLLIDTVLTFGGGSTVVFFEP